MEPIITKYGETNPEYVWACINNIDDLFNCNIAFIENRLSLSFYHYGKLNADSEPLINDLVKLHQYKVFTIGGQGSLLEYDKFINKTWIDLETGELCGNWFCSIEQKPYLSCFIKKSYLKKLIKYFNNLNFNNINDGIKYIITTPSEMITNLDNNICTYTVTREKCYKNKDININNSSWEEPTSIKTCFSYNNYLNIFNFNNFQKIKNIFKKKYIYLDLTTNNYGSTISVEKILLNFFENI